jgi:recombination protein RecT
MAGPRTTKDGQIVRAPENSEQRLVSLVQRMGPEIARALPKHVTPDRMARIVLTAVRMTPGLSECTPASFIGCVMSLSQLGLEPNTPTGQAYLIPRQNRKLGVTECTAIIGYKGMMELARRTGQVSKIQAHVVRAGDLFEYERGTDEHLRHVASDDEDREQRPITHAWAMAKVDGEMVFEVLSRAQIDARRKRSAASEYGPWVTDYEAMAKKSAIRALSPWLPMSAERERAIELEEAVERGAPITGGFDPAITSALKSSGLLDERHEEPAPSAPEMQAEPVPSEPGEAVNQETGERGAR